MLTFIMAVGIMNKPTKNGQPDAQTNAPANPQVRELRQGVWTRCGSEMRLMKEMDNPYHGATKSGLTLLHFEPILEKIVELINNGAPRDEVYSAAICLLAQYWCGIKDQIREIDIKGVNMDGKKYKIILR
jgi:hypothetical protein